MKRRIALLGWGSLLWDGRNDFDAWHGPWRLDGPSLRLEFSRISSTRGGALTLVIDSDNGAPVTVAWSKSRRRSIDQAVEDLRKREKTPTAKNIGRLAVSGEAKSSDENTLASIRAWVIQQGLDGVVWTDLRSNFAEKTGEPFSVDAAVRYLLTLEGEAQARAFEYVRCAPAFVRTPLREAFNKKIGSLATQEP